MPVCSKKEEVNEAIRLNEDMVNIVQNNLPAANVLRYNTRDFSVMYFVPLARTELQKNNVPLLFESALCVQLLDLLYRKNDILH